MTGADGSYTLPLADGTYRIYETCPVAGNWQQSFPAPTGAVCGSGVHNVTVSKGDCSPNRNFGNYQAVSVKACKFEDVDKNPTTTADRVPVPAGPSS